MLKNDNKIINNQCVLTQGKLTLILTLLKAESVDSFDKINLNTLGLL